MIGHPDGCTCHGCVPRPPITSGHTEKWTPGESWGRETLPWLAGQVERSAAVLDGLQRTNMRKEAK